jgi:hypothetical protein
MPSPGGAPERDFNKNTFKAGMYMKTNNYKTNCPEKVGHLCLRFGHFRLTAINLAEIRSDFISKRGNLPTHPQSRIEHAEAGVAWCGSAGSRLFVAKKARISAKRRNATNPDISRRN